MVHVPSDPRSPTRGVLDGPAVIGAANSATGPSPVNLDTLVGSRTANAIRGLNSYLKIVTQDVVERAQQEAHMEHALDTVSNQLLAAEAANKKMGKQLEKATVEVAALKEVVAARDSMHSELTNSQAEVRVLRARVTTLEQQMVESAAKVKAAHEAASQQVPKAQKKDAAVQAILDKTNYSFNPRAAAFEPARKGSAASTVVTSQAGGKVQHEAPEADLISAVRQFVANPQQHQQQPEAVTVLSAPFDATGGFPVRVGNTFWHAVPAAGAAVSQEDRQHHIAACQAALPWKGPSQAPVQDSISQTASLAAPAAETSTNAASSPARDAPPPAEPPANLPAGVKGLIVLLPGPPTPIPVTTAGPPATGSASPHANPPAEPPAPSFTPMPAMSGTVHGPIFAPGSVLGSLSLAESAEWASAPRHRQPPSAPLHRHSPSAASIAPAAAASAQEGTSSTALVSAAAVAAPVTANPHTDRAQAPKLSNREKRQLRRKTLTAEKSAVAADAAAVEAISVPASAASVSAASVSTAPAGGDALVVGGVVKANGVGSTGGMRAGSTAPSTEGMAGASGAWAIAAGQGGEHARLPAQEADANSKELRISHAIGGHATDGHQADPSSAVAGPSDKQQVKDQARAISTLSKIKGNREGVAELWGTLQSSPKADALAICQQALGDSPRVTGFVKALLSNLGGDVGQVEAVEAKAPKLSNREKQQLRRAKRS